MATFDEIKAYVLNMMNGSSKPFADRSDVFVKPMIMHAPDLDSWRLNLVVQRPGHKPVLVEVATLESLKDKITGAIDQSIPYEKWESQNLELGNIA